MFYEDATPYLYVKELIEGVRTNTEIRHVFVDEGQDYSPFQYEYLKKLFPRARMTVLGDFGQAIFTQATNLARGRFAADPALRRSRNKPCPPCAQLSFNPGDRGIYEVDASRRGRDRAV